MNRRHFLKTLAALGASAALPLSGCLFGGSDGKSQKPNIILFLADDLGWVDSDVYGSDFYETPAIRRLAQEGITFTQAYAQPLCSPSRAALLTGKYPCARLRMHSAITRECTPEPVVPATAASNQKMCYPESRDRLPPEEYTVAEALKEAGYQTWHLGKWHLKPAPGTGNEQCDPINQGFDVQIGVGGAGPGSSYFAPYTVPSFPPGPDGEYIAERMAEEACNLMENRDIAKPFFMHYGEFNVHAPYNAKQDLIDYYTAKAQQMGPGKHRNPTYAAMVHGLDEVLGKLLDKVDQLGIAENTVMVFISDNGGISWNVQSIGTSPTSNHPLRGHKHTYYEGGVRVPMIVRWPFKVKRASTASPPIHIIDTPSASVSTLVHIIDLFPTFLEIAGGTVSNDVILDGVSLVPLFDGGRIPQRPLFCHFPRAGFGMAGGSFVRQVDYKLIRIYGEGPDRSDRYELYNLKTDIGESNDLSSKMPEKVTQMAALLDHWLTETGALMPIKNPAYAP